jgi:hypothetical protein
LRKSIEYFESPGPANTDEAIRLARERAIELGIRDVVVASTHGGTGLKVAEAFKDLDCNLVVVTVSEAFEDEGWVMAREERQGLVERGIRVYTGVHALGDGVDSAFAERYGGKPFSEVVAQTLYRFGQGTKTCVEIVLMAADAGLIPMDREVVAIAGTDGGADTALVVDPAYPRRMLDLKIKEIIAKPR